MPPAAVLAVRPAAPAGSCALHCGRVVRRPARITRAATAAQARAPSVSCSGRWTIHCGMSRCGTATAPMKAPRQAQVRAGHELAVELDAAGRGRPQADAQGHEREGRQAVDPAEVARVQGLDEERAEDREVHGAHPHPAGHAVQSVAPGAAQQVVGAQEQGDGRGGGMERNNSVIAHNAVIVGPRGVRQCRPHLASRRRGRADSRRRRARRALAAQGRRGRGSVHDARLHALRRQAGAARRHAPRGVPAARRRARGRAAHRGRAERPGRARVRLPGGGAGQPAPLRPDVHRRLQDTASTPASGRWSPRLPGARPTACSRATIRSPWPCTCGRSRTAW